MKNLIFLLVLVVLYACDVNTNSTNDQTPKSWAETVMAIPDDMATPDELKLKNTVLKVIGEGVAVENNQFVLTLDKKHFKNCGIPEVYYDLLEKELIETNRALETMMKEQDIDLKGALVDFKVNLTKHLQQLESKE